MRGLPYVASLGYGLFTPDNSVAGVEVAGTVDGIVKHVTRFKRGNDRSVPIEDVPAWART